MDGDTAVRIGGIRGDRGQSAAVRHGPESLRRPASRRVRRGRHPDPARQRVNPLGPVRIVIGADPVGAGRARGRDHPGATHGGQLLDQFSGDSARAMDQHGLAGLHGQRTCDHLLGRQRRNGKHRRVRPRHARWLRGAISGGADHLLPPVQHGSEAHRHKTRALTSPSKALRASL